MASKHIVASCDSLRGRDAHISNGYTKALAKTAPVAPATAKPQGGMGATFDCPAIVMMLENMPFKDSVQLCPGLGVLRAAEARGAAGFRGSVS